MHYYQHHIGDFIKDTSYLTNEEVGIYMKLLWLYYDTEKPLPKNLFVLSMKANARDSESIVTGILNMFFIETDDGWHHTRCDQEIAHYHSLIENASKAGKASALKRAINSRSTIVQPTSNQEPVTKNHIKTIQPEGFDLFWNAYDKKVGKPNAIKQWQKIKPDAQLIAIIVNKAKADKVAKPDNKYRKDPERWLKGQHWLDEVIVEQATKPKELPLGTEQQIEEAYRVECGGDPRLARFNSYFEMRKFIIDKREERARA